MKMETKEYEKFKNYKPLNLDLMYKGDLDILNALDYNLEQIIELESPLTYNTLKERLREIFSIAKISSKALDIILEHLKKIKHYETNNLYDNVIWKNNSYTMNYLRVGYQRQIYDIPKEELSLVFLAVKDNNLDKDDLYHKVLNYLGYEVLTKKALEYLDFVYNYIWG